MKSILALNSLVGLMMVTMTSQTLINTPGVVQTVSSLFTLNGPDLLATLFPTNGNFPSNPWTGPTDPDMNKTTAQIIQMRGWGVQLHYPVTPDGYILGVQRIVNPNGKPFTGKSVLLHHGLGSSSVCWVLNDPHSGFYGEAIDDSNVGGNLAFELAKRGFDVWLPNTRGNKYSRNHTTLSPYDPEFWNYSIDEMIKYDVPTVINYARNVSGQATVGWVGHSQGTMIMFGFLSRNPSYSDVIKPFVALAPVAYTSYMGGPLGLLIGIPGSGLLLGSMKSRFPPMNFNLPAMTGAFCQGNIPDDVCNTGVYLLMGGGLVATNMNDSRVGVYLGDESLDSSNKNIGHFAYDGSENKFQSFNYQLGNLAKYGSLTPPQYDLSKITSTNMAFIWSAGDFLADPTDVSHLIADLRVNLTANWYIDDDSFSHLNFIYGYSTGSLVNTRVLQVLNNNIQP